MVLSSHSHTLLFTMFIKGMPGMGGMPGGMQMPPGMEGMDFASM